MALLGSLESPEEEITAIFFKHQKNYKNELQFILIGRYIL